MAAVYYICFNKLPPRQAKKHEVVSFSIVVQNDLREVVYEPSGEEGPLRLCLTWLSADSTKPLEHAGTLEWTRASQAYSTVEIQLPRRLGTSAVRLAVYQARDRVAEPWVYDLGAHSEQCEEDALVFLPIVSPSIHLQDGQTDDRLAYRLFSISPGSVIRMREQGGFSLEGHLWDAALHLASYMIKEKREITRNIKNVLELGAGTGLISIVFSHLLQDRRTVTRATDLKAALELLRSNVDDNAGSSVDVSELDWEHSERLQSLHDMVYVADCTYNPSSFTALCRTISLALSTDAQCILSKKHRHVDEDDLWPSLQRAGLTYELIAGNDARLDHDALYSYTGWGIYRISRRYNGPSLP